MWHGCMCLLVAKVGSRVPRDGPYIKDTLYATHSIQSTHRRHIAAQHFEAALDVAKITE